MAALKEKSHLRVWPIPATARAWRKLVPPMTKAAIACGADGILIEVHPDPEKALTDGAQTISVKISRKLIKESRRWRRPWGGRCRGWRIGCLMYNKSTLRRNCYDRRRDIEARMKAMDKVHAKSEIQKKRRKSSWLWHHRQKKATLLHAIDGSYE